MVEEWNYTKNGLLKPNMVAANSGKKVWWLCNKCKYEWEAVIASRNKGCGCPKCSNVAAANKLSKKIIQYDIHHNFVKVWESISSASRELGINNSLIVRCCKGKIKTCGGFIFEYFV